MDKKKIIAIVLVCSIVIIGIIILVINHSPSYDKYPKPEEKVENTADRLLLSYDRTERKQENRDMTNSGKTVEEMNRDYEKAMNSSKGKSFNKIDWSYSDTAWMADYEALTSDEYGYLVKYVLNLEVEFKTKDTDITTEDGYTYVEFDYLSNGRNATYKIFYNLDETSIYVYAFVQ